MSKYANQSIVVGPVTDEPAGSRVPRPYKKTFSDKMPEWIGKFK